MTGAWEFSRDSSSVVRAQTVLNRSNARPDSLRRSSVRESLTFSWAPGPVGSPPTVNTDASIGFCCIGHPGFGAAFYLCDADDFCWFLWREPASGPYAATEQNVAQRAKVGLFPRRAMATHVTAPLLSASGEHHYYKDGGPTLRVRFGPRPPRRPAACHFAKCFGSFSPAWDWAAASLLRTLRFLFCDPLKLTSICPFSPPPPIHPHPLPWWIRQLAPPIYVAMKLPLRPCAPRPMSPLRICPMV